MKTNEIKNHWNSISSDMLEIWILVWDFLEKVKNKVKKLIFKK